MVEHVDWGMHSDTGMEIIPQSLVQISPSWDEGATGLGIICGEFIFTCAHLGESRPMVGSFLDVPLYNVRRLHDGEEGVFAELVATSNDFMVLAPNGFGVVLADDDGPTDSSFAVLRDKEWELNDLRPSKIVHHGNQQDPMQAAGFLFSPDGTEMHAVEYQLWPHDPLIRFMSNETQPGCSGGPLFTRDHHLIGVHANVSRHPIGGRQRECLGRRIDLCSPMFVYERVEWRTMAGTGVQSMGDLYNIEETS